MSNGGLISGAFSSTTGFADTVMTTNGDIVYYNSGRQRLPKEDNDDVLTLKSGLPSWEAAAGGATVARVQSKMESDFTTTSTSDVDVTNFTADLPTITSGFVFITAGAECRVSVADNSYYLSIDNGAVVAIRAPYMDTAGYRMPTVVTYVDDADGGTIQMVFRTGAGTGYVYGASEPVCQIQMLGVG